MYGYETFHEDLMKNLIESVHNGASSPRIYLRVKRAWVYSIPPDFCGGIDVQNTGVAPAEVVRIA